MSVLENICAKKREHIAAKMRETPLEELRDLAFEAENTAGFVYALKRQGGPALIAEVKKASPSKGVIREDFDPAAIARIYEESGAACISVLTDEPYFQGHDNDLKQVKDAVSIPVLRKDFMLEPYQIYESRALGADCILLIMAALADEQARELYDLAREMDMDVLVEIHDQAELGRAIGLNSDLIGVNNRNLKSLEVDINVSIELSQQIPEGTLKVAESGIYTPQDIKTLREAGYRAFLVGESLMREDNIGQAVKTLIG